MAVRRTIYKEALTIISIGIASFIIAGQYDFLEQFIEFSRAHEDWELDELLITCVVLSFCLTVVLIKRSRQLNHEINLRIEIEQELARQALIDPLTNLPNRRNFLPRFKESVEQARTSNIIQAVLFIDIDDFKKINDTYGHTAGDELLVKISDLLSDSIRKTDLISRIAGDEFIIHLSNIQDRDEASLVAEKILERVYSSDDNRISLSIGIALMPEHASTAEELIASADSAMYIAKERGKNQYCYYA